MPTPDEIERAISYLHAQAAEKSIEELIARVQEGVEELHAAARAVPERVRAAVPGGDEWSPADCLAHAVGWNILNATQVLHVAHTGELPSAEEASLPADFDSMLARHSEAMESLYEHVRAADPQAYLHVRWEHPIFGPLNWREWLLFLRLHSRDHARQLAAMHT